MQKPKARTLILNRLIEETREKVIEYDIECKFLESLNLTDEENLKQLCEYKKAYEFYLKKLTFLKDMREQSKLASIHSIIENTPNKISVVID